jgi:small subunit ribosomal protein S3
MGQKVNPYGVRLGIIRESRSKWFAQGRQFRDQLTEDLQARKLIHERHHHAAISDVIIERAAGTTTITIESAKPGIIIGRGGGDVDRLRRELDKMMSGKVRVNVEETKTPEVNAQLVAEEIAGQIERRASIRRAMTQAIERTMRAGAVGVRVAVSGRLMGAEIARTERVGPVGRVPLHTLRADVELGISEAFTTYGHIGVKVWVCKGEILPPRKEEVRPPAPAAVEPAVEAEVEPEAAVEAEAPEIAEAVEADAVSVEPEAVGVEPDLADVEMVVQQLSVDEAEEVPSEVPEPVAATADEEPVVEEEQAEEAADLQPRAAEEEVAESEQAAEEDTGDVDAEEAEIS